MIRGHKRAFAALLVMTALLVPGVGFAESAPTLPAPTVPASPAKSDDSLLMEAKISKDDAIAAARKVFSIPAELGDPVGVNLSQTRDGAAWYLNWQTSSKVPQSEFMNISVQVDAQTGVILSYDRSERVQKDAPPLTYSRDEARAVADKWLAQLAGELKGSLQYVDMPAANYYYGGNINSYQYVWQRVEQGYPVQSDRISIGIDGRTGDLQHFNIQWSKQAAFTKPDTLLSQDQAKEVYRTQLSLDLFYQRFTEPGTDKGEWKLIYRPRSGWMPVSQDGKLLNGSGDPVAAADLAGYAMVPSSDKAYVKPEKPLTKDEALAVARAVSGRTDAPNYVNYNQYGEGQKTSGWNFSWNVMGEMKEGEYNTNVQVDADRGVVTNFGNYGMYQQPKEGQEPKFSFEDARKVAIEWIRANRPDLAGQIQVQMFNPYANNPKMLGMTSYSIQFMPLKNGVMLADRMMNVEVDAMTGAVRNFWDNGQVIGSADVFPDQSNLIPVSDALSAFLTNQGLALTWYTFWQPDPSASKFAPGPGKPVAKLVWAPQQTLQVAMIDAKTGSLLDWSGRDVVAASKRPTDIAGHYAEREIEMLWTRGVVDVKNGLFRPDETITMAELSKWLVLSRGLQPYMNYDFSLRMGAGNAVATKMALSAEAPYMGAAMQAGIFLPDDFDEKADPNAAVSRELLALWVARAMGYGAIAKMPNRIDMPFSDKESIGEKYRNAVGILNGLGVVKGMSDGTFAPQGLVNRGEAAKVLFSVTAEPWAMK